MNTITPHELNEVHRRDGNVRLIDVRTPAEFREAHVPFAENRPLESLNPTAFAEACGGSGDTIYVICQKGGRGANACIKLVGAGLQNVVNVEGGTAAWEQAGLPVIRGKKTISLERQVRIAAGLLVLIGVFLGLFAHPYWFALAAFVGAGLTFAGITDTCGMGMLLARMPWNQVQETTNAQSHVACCKG